MLSNILNVVIAVLVFVLAIFIKRAPKHFSEYILEETKNKNVRQLQVESYFKEIGSKEQLRILSEWSHMLIDLEYLKENYGKDDVDKINHLIHDTLIYGSDKTVKLLSLYMQNSYSQKYQADDGNYESLVNIAYIVSSLKEDFTGYKISPQTLLKLKITDYQDNEQGFKKAEEEINKVIEE